MIGVAQSHMKAFYMGSLDRIGYQTFVFVFLKMFGITYVEVFHKAGKRTSKNNFYVLFTQIPQL